MLDPAPKTFEITVSGLLDAVWLDWFDIESLSSDEQPAPRTVLRVRVADQAALHGLLTKIRDLNLPLVALREIQA